MNTLFRFQDEFTIPANFFGSGSDPFMGTVMFGSMPIGYYQGMYLGTTDTIVGRTQAADLSSGMATVPIELKALSLVSVNPITVTDHGGLHPSFFDVFVDISPAMSSTGGITIRSSGTFDSWLLVFPRFIFIRENDTFTKPLDVGQLFPVICPGSLAQQCKNDLNLTSTGTPWVTPPCPSDDFIVTGLNDQFCPGSNPTVPIRFTEQSRLEAHSVIPIQGPHWKCYSIATSTGQPPLNKLGNLRDQFENETGITIGVAQILCNPVSKLLIQGARQIQFSPPLEPHLKCYTVTPSSDPKLWINATTQFGRDLNLDIDGSKWLCVQAAKLITNKANRIPLAPILQLQPDVKCYSLDNTGKTPNIGTRLWDEFHNETVSVNAPAYFCTPVTKAIGTASGIPVSPLTAPHLQCYNITEPAVQTIVNLRDVFENETGVIVGIPQYLCAYAVKQSVGPEPQPLGRTSTLTPSLLLLAVTTLTISFAVLIRRRKTSARPINDLNANGMKPALDLLPRRMLQAVGALRKFF